MADNNEPVIMDGFRTVCVDNIRALLLGETVFVYKKDVLEETKKLCQKKGIKIICSKAEDYYTIKNVNRIGVKSKFRNI